MTNFLRFASLAGLTQVVLLLNQLFLLPLQVHTWGNAATAEWYAAMAFAAIVTVADFGLRTAGHAELISSLGANPNPSDAVEVERIWRAIKVLMLVTTLAVLVADFVGFLVVHRPYVGWRLLLILSLSIETLIIIRVMYLDSAALYKAAEGGYLLFVATRLALAVTGIVFFHVREAGLATIYFCSAAGALAVQGYFCQRRLGMLKMLGPLRIDEKRRLIGIIRNTVSGPCATWIQMNLPVLVLSAIASSATVTSYVALRAVFGLARQTNLQVARFASVQYLKLRTQGRTSLADASLSILLIGSGFLGAVLGFALLTDDQRLFGLWVGVTDREIYLGMVVSFSLTACVMSYQIIIGLLMRLGRLADVARRQYTYSVFATLFALSALQLRTQALYFWLLAAAEVGMAVAFMTSRVLDRTPRFYSAGWRALAAAAVCGVAEVALWSIRTQGWMGQPKPDAVTSAAFLVGFSVLLAVILGWLNVDLLRTVAASLRRSAPRTTEIVPENRT